METNSKRKRLVVLTACSVIAVASVFSMGAIRVIGPIGGGGWTFNWWNLFLPPPFVSMPFTPHSGRVVYIPPIYSGRHWSCPSGVTFTYLVSCYDFSVTNLTNISQTVRLTALHDGTDMINLGLDKAAGVNPVSFSAGTFNLKDKRLSTNLRTEDPVASGGLGTPINVPGTAGASVQAAFCMVCSSGGCNMGWTTSIGGSGTITAPAGSGTSGNATTNTTQKDSNGNPIPITSESLSYSATADFVLSVDEYRGALLGRIDQRQYSWAGGGPARGDCTDEWTSPQVMVEINQGRTF